MGSKVLLADDSITIQKVVGIIFANEGYELTVVASGDAALQKAVEIKPDVMLVDALMPGKNGYEVCHTIRQDPALAHTAILLMTGAFEVIDEEKSRQSGADEFITKPFESQTLIEATNRMIALTRSRAASVTAPEVAAAYIAPAPVDDTSVDDVWATGFDMEPPITNAASTVDTFSGVFAEPVSEIEPVKATVDDDIWGAFDLDAVASPFEPAAVTSQPVAATPAADDFFTFETPNPVVVPEPEPKEVAFGNSFSGGATFAGFETEPVNQVAAQPVAQEEDFSTISFDEPVAPVVIPQPVAPPVVESPAFAPAINAAPAPSVFGTPPPLPPVAEALPTPAIQAVAATIGAFDEAQVKELLASLSREIIEKIVWEVVPDLAETLIKEEIRKLKTGIA